MPRLTELRSAIYAAIENCGDLPPCEKVEVVTGPQDAPKSFGGDASVQMLIRVYTGPVGQEAAQVALDTMLDPQDNGSLLGAVLTDEQLKQAVKSIRPVKTSGWLTWQPDKDRPPVMGAEWTLEVTT